MPIIQVIECTYVVNFLCVNSLDSQILNQRKEYLLNAKGHFFLWLIWLWLRRSLAIWETARVFNIDIKVFAWYKLSFWKFKHIVLVEYLIWIFIVLQIVFNLLRNSNNYELYSTIIYFLSKQLNDKIHFELIFY